MKYTFQHLPTLASILVCFSISTSLFGQATDLKIKVISGTKTVYEEAGRISEIADGLYQKELETLTAKTLAAIKSGIKVATGQTSYREQVKLANHTQFSVYGDGTKTYVRCILPRNSIELKITTPDIPIIGIGVDRVADPLLLISYTLTGNYEVVHNGNAGDLRLKMSGWSCNIDDIKGIGKDGTMAAVAGSGRVARDANDWIRVYFPEIISQHYFSLNPMAETITAYFDQKVKKNATLAEDFKIDENETILVKTNEDANLLSIVHPYSAKGSVKRNATDKAASINQQSNISTAGSVPTSKSASSILDKPSVGNNKKPKIN